MVESSSQNRCYAFAVTTYVYLAVEEAKENTGIESILRFMKAAPIPCRPRHGIGFRSKRCEDPEGFVTGAIHTAPGVLSEVDKRRRTKWSHELIAAIDAPSHARLRNGMIRDVYEVNIVSDDHLMMEVGGQPLRRWIADATYRGTAENSHYGWLWRVKEGDVDRVREELRESGLLIVNE